MSALKKSKVEFVNTTKKVNEKENTTKKVNEGGKENEVKPEKEEKVEFDIETGLNQTASSDSFWNNLKLQVPQQKDNKLHIDSEDDENIILLEGFNLGNESAANGEEITTKNCKIFNKLDYKDVEYKIDRMYFDMNDKYSSALDILASYLKGHKIVYMESKFYCEKQLNMFMMPAILFSTAATVLTSFLTNNYVWGVLFISALNGVIAFLLAVVNYLKLDAAAEAHKISSHQYDKLQSIIEFTSGEVLLFSNTELQQLEYELEQTNDVIVKAELKKQIIHQKGEFEKTMKKKLTEVGNKIEEIKETNQFIIPRTVRLRYPVIYNTNIFTVIKRIDDLRKKTITDLTTIKNEIRYFTQLKKSYESSFLACKTPTSNQNSKLKIIARIVIQLFEKKRTLVNEIILLKSAFSVIDQMFHKEISDAEEKRSSIFWVSREVQNSNPENMNEFIRKLMDPFSSVTIEGSDISSYYYDDYYKLYDMEKPIRTVPLKKKAFLPHISID